MKNGETLGHYVIETLVGKGAHASVYRARDTRLERTVAIKIVDGGSQDSPTLEQVLKEARAASALNHPNICVIHEVGQANGQGYIVMEFVDGQPISKLIATCVLDMDRIIRLGAEIASALAHAHERGIVHRDLKSLNVVVTLDGRAKVLDFGLANTTLSDSLIRTS
jgi:serine/threonine protein kinase